MDRIGGMISAETGTISRNEKNRPPVARIIFYSPGSAAVRLS